MDQAQLPGPVFRTILGVITRERKSRLGRKQESLLVALFATLLVVLATGCSLDSLLNSNQLPPDVTDPTVTQTPSGARQAYYGTLDQFRTTFGGYGQTSLSFVEATGILSDELLGWESGYGNFDRRVSPDGTVLYNNINRVRGQAGQAIHLLTLYLPDQPALAGHLYALKGYAEIFLAELFCSGIPLSTIDYGGDYTYQPGSSTDEVLGHAVALFDTALTLTEDSASLLDLARVGRARALLGRNEYAAAAAASAAVPDVYHYDVQYGAFAGSDTTKGRPQNFAYVPLQAGIGLRWSLTVPNREGVNGLDWVTSGDPRTIVNSQGTGTYSSYTVAVYHPNKYAIDGSSAIVLASGIEARLIEAEAALRNGDTETWLTVLNALRTDGTFDVTTTSPPDTLWHAGSGGVNDLRPLNDPGTENGRVDLLFRERAFWLFLTGHRQGDLRRLIRQYQRLESKVYPIGPYLDGQLSYGSDVTVSVPQKEEQTNPLYMGCASHGA